MSPGSTAQNASASGEREPVDEHPRRHRRPPFRQILAVWLVWMTACWAVIGGLLAPVIPGGGWGIAVLIALNVLPVLALVQRVRGGSYPGAAFRLWLVRPFWYGQLVVPLLALAGLAGMLLGFPFGAAPAVGRAALAAAAAATLILGVLGYLGSRRLTVRRLEATHPALPHEFDGFRIVQISDLHVGPQTSRRFLARARSLVEDAMPDLIAVTGDQVDDFAPDVEQYAAAFGTLSAPCGVFIVPGNHDVYAGWNEVRQRLGRLSATLLVNDHRVLERGGARLAVVGTGDPAGRAWSRDGGAAAASDLDAALGGVPDGCFRLVLAHNPSLWPALARRGAEATLSGHTHWGQLALSALGWSLASPFLDHAMGSHREGNSLLYIHPGTNYWGIPFRLGTPPEVAIITLRRGESAGITTAA